MSILFYLHNNQIGEIVDRDKQHYLIKFKHGQFVFRAYSKNILERVQIKPTLYKQPTLF